MNTAIINSANLQTERPRTKDTEYLAIAHRSLLRARSREQLTKLLLSADKVKLIASASKISDWHLATWAKDRTDIWRP